MSLTGAMFTGFTGIYSNGVSVDVVGDNLANLNTTSFKSQRTLFETLLYRTAGEAMDAAPPLFTGAKTVEWPGGWQREKRILFVQDQPLPLNLAGFVPQMQTNEMVVG